MSQSIPDLVTEGAEIRKLVADKGKRLKEIEAALIAAGPGLHEDGKGTKVSVVAAGESVCVPADLDAVKEAAGEHFGKLFEREVSYKPVKGFAEIVGALFKKPAAKKILNLCRKVRSAYVKWS